MSSPLNDPCVTDWFRRFDAAARHLPDADRAAQHEELRQHLDSLAAASAASGQSPEAAQQNALSRLGDPWLIGRKLDREWQQSRTGFRMDIKAIGLGLTLWMVCYCMTHLLSIFWLHKHLCLYSTGHHTYAIYRIGHQSYYLYTNGYHWIGLASTILEIYSIATLIFIYSVVGRKYPYQSLRSAFFTRIIVMTYGFWLWCLDAVSHHSLYRTDIGFNTLQFLWYSIAAVAIAYLASVTRRGWYRPSLADFRVCLPKKKARA